MHSGGNQIYILCDHTKQNAKSLTVFYKDLWFEDKDLRSKDL